MPFIRGRYHINPIAGEALEAAREMEEALAALHNEEQDHADSDNYEWSPESCEAGQKGPIHRVEIETASVVPAHSGQTSRGFVAHVHRASYAPSQSAVSAEHGRAVAVAQPTRPMLQKPETHVFASDGDLVDFLQRELARDAARRDANQRQ